MPTSSLYGAKNRHPPASAGYRFESCAAHYDAEIIKATTRLRARRLEALDLGPSVRGALAARRVVGSEEGHSLKRGRESRSVWGWDLSSRRGAS